MASLPQPQTQNSAKESVKAQAEKLSAAKSTYDTAVQTNGDLEANKKALENISNELGELTTGIDEIYDQWIKEADEDINDLKALLSGYNGTYQLLKETADGAAGEVNSKGEDLIRLNKELGGSEEDQNLTADQIVAKYDKAVGDNKTISTQIDEHKKTISDCNNNEGTLRNNVDETYRILSADLGYIDKKFDSDHYKYNEEIGQYEFETDQNNNPYLTDSYKELLARSQSTEKIYKNGNEVLDKNVNAAYTDSEGAKYITVGEEYFDKSELPEWLKEFDLSNSVTGGSPLSYDSEKDKLVQTVGIEISENYKAGDQLVSKNQKGKITLPSEPAESDYEYEILRAVLNDALHAELTLDQVKAYKQAGSNTLIFTLTKENASRLSGNIDESHKLEYKIKPNQTKLKKEKGQWVLSYQFDHLNEMEAGTYYWATDLVATREYDYKKYELDSVIAKRDLDDIDEVVDLAMGQVNGHKKQHDDNLREYYDLLDRRADAADALYGYYDGGSEDKPLSGSLLDEKGKNDTIISTLASKISEYNTALYYKNSIDELLKKADEFDPEKASNLTQEQKALYNKAVNAKQVIIDEKAKAKNYLKSASSAITGLDTDLKNVKDGNAAYELANERIISAQNRLSEVEKKLEVLDKLKSDAEGRLASKNVDDKIGDVSINDTCKNLNGKLAELSKFDPNDYKDLDYVAQNLMGMEVLSIDILSESLAAAINTAGEVLEAANGNLSEIEDVREEAEKKAEQIAKDAENAQAEANRAAKALADWRAPEDPDDDDDDDSSSSSSSDIGSFITYTTPETGITLIPLGGDGVGAGIVNRGRTVAGNRAADNTGVLGARADEEVRTKNDTVETAKQDDSSSSSNTGTKDTKEQEVVQVDSNIVPLAATPFEDNKTMNWIWLLGAGAAAGVGAGAYASRKRKATAQQKTKE